MLHDAEISVDFEDQRDQILIAQAVNGKDSVDFLCSSVGRWVTGAAVQEQSEIERELAAVAPWRKKKITRLQLKHQAITLAIGWITEAVNLGEAAMRELQEPEE